MFIASIDSDFGFVKFVRREVKFSTPMFLNCWHVKILNAILKFAYCQSQYRVSHASVRSFLSRQTESWMQISRGHHIVVIYCTKRYVLLIFQISYENYELRCSNMWWRVVLLSSYQISWLSVYWFRGETGK